MTTLLIKYEHAPAGFVRNLASALEEKITDACGDLSVYYEGDSDVPSADVDLVLLLTTQADLESGWLREALSESQVEGSRKVVFFGDVDESVVKDHEGLLFNADSETRRQTFHALLEMLGGGPAEPTEDLAPSQPCAEVRGSATFFDEVFERLADNPALLLLAQSGRGQRLFIDQLEQEAIGRLGKAQVFSAKPPASLDVSVPELFAHLGRQCGFQGVERQFDWERCLQDRVRETGKVLLLISRFEHASKQSQEAIAQVLRGLSEQLDFGRFLVVFSGGEKLAQQKILVTESSFLNHADWMLVPDLTKDDLIAWNKEGQFSDELPEELAEALIDRYGSHPGLLMQSLGVLRRLDQLDLQAMSKVQTAEQQQGWLVHLFLPWVSPPQEADRLCTFLSRPEAMGRFSYWPSDSTVRGLFWKNLITEHDGQFQWRSSALAQAGWEILGCPGRTQDSGEFET